MEENLYMSDNQGDRVKEIRSYFDMTQKEFAKFAGISQPYLSSLERNERQISADFIKKITNCMPGINLNWLFLGAGSMLLSGNIVEEKFIKYKVKDDEDSSDLCTPNFVHLSDDDVHPIADFEHILQNGHVFVPVWCQAGYLAESIDQDIAQELEIVRVPGISGKARTFEIEGRSMEPVLLPGDYLSCLPVERGDTLEQDHIYVIVSKMYGITAKYITQENDHIRLRPHNTADYRDHTLDLSSVKEIWRAHTRITRSFDVQGDHKEMGMVVRWLDKQHPNWRNQI